jgi:hypothetical protein
MKRKTFLGVVLVCSLLTLGCGAKQDMSQSNGSEKPKVSETPQATEKLTVAMLCENPSRYEGQTVKLEGTYHGWRADECRLASTASPSMTRSDWLVRTGSDCIYVTGGMPGDLDPMNPEDIGQWIVLEAVVERRDDGHIYLRYVDVQRINKK